MENAGQVDVDLVQHMPPKCTLKRRCTLSRGTKGYLENSYSASVHGACSSLSVEVRLKVKYSPMASLALSQVIDEDGTKQCLA